MKKTIKLLTTILSLILVLVFIVSCGNNESKTDLEYVKDKGVLIVGITDFAPMDYQDENGEWIGFDADLAKAFAEYLGVKVQFNEIIWDYKLTELDGKSIDCVWNGMTLTDDVKESMSTSIAYCNNQQIIIMNKSKIDDYKTTDDCMDLQFAVESQSAGNDMADEYGFKYTAVKSQAAAVMEVASGTADAAIIDSLMAAATVGKGTAYEDLAYSLPLNNEEYGVGFRKESNITEEFNKFYQKALEDGTVEKLAEKYGVQAALIK